jgi:hypothetical protein
LENIVGPAAIGFLTPSNPRGQSGKVERVEGKVRRAYFVDDGEIAFAEFADESQGDFFVFLW